MNLKWIMQDNVSKDLLDKYENQLKIPKIISRILLNRGIDTYEKAKLFFRGKLKVYFKPQTIFSLYFMVLKLYKVFFNLFFR